MTTSNSVFTILCSTLCFFITHMAHAEWDDESASNSESSEEMFREETQDGKKKSFKTYKRYEKSRKTLTPAEREEREEEERRRKYYVADTERVDAGTFHVGFAAGGNFYIEPKFDGTGAPLGEYFKDFGFQGGAYFDFDYTDMALGLRGFVGYKYILNSVHVFAFEAAARLRFELADSAAFGLGLGPGASLWYRESTSQTQGEEVLFLPFLILSAGFDFNPFMIDFKFPIHRIGTNTTILGMELYFGVRL